MVLQRIRDFFSRFQRGASESRRIVILANSYKPGGRCIAGKEVAAMQYGQISGGAWIRPVPDKAGGGLSRDKYKLGKGGYAAVFDIVDVPCAEPAGDIRQPENRVIKPGAKWNKVGRISRNQLALLCDQPTRLWHSTDRTDRVSSEFLRANPPKQSLYLIHLSYGSIIADYRSGYRLRFRYNGAEYSLKITDPDLPEIRNRYCESHGRIQLRDFHACISLGEEFHGYHYKIVATLFP